MIPNVNNLNNFNNQIKIQLTTDNKCLIQALSESPIKSQATLQKEDFSLNEDMSLSKSNNSLYNNVNNNNSQNESKPIVMNSNKKNSNNDFDSNSNLLISFSNISEVTKNNNNDCSMTRINSNKNNSIIMNKEKDFVKNINNNIIGDKNLTINNIANFEGNSIISNNNFFIINEKNNINSIKTPLRNINQNNKMVNQNKTSNKKEYINKKLLNAFNKNDLSEISCGNINLNLNVEDKSENYDKVNFVYSDKKCDDNSIQLNFKNIESKEEEKKNGSDYKKNNVKCFKNCSVQKNEEINIIQINPNKENTIKNTKIIDKRRQNEIVPKHCTNFTFTGTIKNNNKLKDLEINNIMNKDNQDKQKSANLNIFQNLINTHTISNTNTLDMNDDYVSPTFNLKLNYNSLDKNNNNVNTIDIDSSKEKENIPESSGMNKINTNNIGITNYNNFVNNVKDVNNINIKMKKGKNKRELFVKKQKDKIINNNNLKNQLTKNKTTNINNDLIKMNKTQEKNISITTNSNSIINSKSLKDKDNKEISPKLSSKPKISQNNNYQNINNIINNMNLNLNEKNNNIKIINNKNKQNSRYKHYNVDSAPFNYDLIFKNLNNSMVESDHKKKLSISSHIKSKSGMGSIIKFQGLHKNIFNIKYGTFVKSNKNLKKTKKFKSISPKMQRRNMNNACLKIKYKQNNKSQNRSKTNSIGKMSKNEMNHIKLLMNNKKGHLNMNNIYLPKPRTLQEKMDFILSKNILALTKKLRKSPSPKTKISRPSLIKNVVINSQGKIVDNLRKNHFMNKNMNRNSSKENSKSKKKSPSPIHFKLVNGNNGNTAYSLYNVNTNPNLNNKKTNIYLNNNLNNYINDNLLLINNNGNPIKKVTRKNTGNSPKNRELNNNHTNQKKNIQVYDNFNINSNYQKVKNNKNAIINKKLTNIDKIEDDFNKRQYNQKNKNMLMNDINKKNNIIIINNIKISNNNNNNNKKNMKIIENFSKYKKKGEISMINTNKLNKRSCQNENISNNFISKGKNINEEKHYKKNDIHLNINNIANKTIEDKKKKSRYNTSQQKKSELEDEYYTS